MLELASSSSTTSTPTTALGAAVSAATDLLFASPSPPATAPPLETAEAEATEEDGAGVPTALAVAAAIERDFENDYFLTGKISGEVYSRDCAFVDPTVTVEGLPAWRRNIALLGRYLDSPRVELVAGRIAVVGAEEGARAEGDFARGDALVASSSSSPAAAAAAASSRSGSSGEEGGDSKKGHAVVAWWRLVAPVSLLPWRPVVDVQGVTVYRLAGEEEGRSEGGGRGGGGGETTYDDAVVASSSPPPPPPSSPSLPPRVVVVRHTEAWVTSPGAALAQLLVPGGRAAAGR